MSTPSPTARGTPSAIHFEDGFSTKVTFATNTTIGFWEKTVTPPGLDGGDPVDQTTMHNVTYRTMSPRHLKTMTPFTLTAAWDPILYTDILALINVKTTVTVTFPDGSTLAFYGFLQKFEPGEFAEGTQPTASITVCPTNADPTTGAESAAALANVAGT